MKKILALVLALALVCCMLISCDDNVLLLIEKADAALKEAPYAVTMKTSFKSDNAEVDKIFLAMNMEIPMTVDGKNVAMDMSLDMMGYSANIKMTVADMVLYYNTEMFGQSIKMKAALNEEQYKEFMEESNTEMMIDPKDFSELTVETKNGKKYIACGKISEEGLKELNDLMEDALEAIGGKATVSDITYGVTLDGGKYESMEMTCVYSVSAAGETCNVTFKLSAEFSYDNVAKITAPADADKYQDTSFGDLMG